MRIISLIFILLIPIFSCAQLRDSVRVKTTIFEIIYSETKESPLLIKYNVLCPTGTVSRNGMDFYTNDSIHTSDNYDYVNNVYDKGHMAPAADFNCTKEMLKLTFTYLNSALQNQYLNRGVWKTLEIQEREWAKTDNVEVTIQVVFNNTCEKLSSGATVPLGFYKTIKLSKLDEPYRYYFPNVRPQHNNLLDYQIK